MAGCPVAYILWPRWPDQVVEADREALRAAGLTDRYIWDIAATAGFFNMSNRVASATDMQPNDEYHAMAR